MNSRKLIAMVSIVGTIVSCTVIETELTDVSRATTEKEITITAFNGEYQTRTERAQDGSVLWSPGDRISLFYGSGTEGGSCFTSQNTELAASANFTGTINVITCGNEVSMEDTWFWATYPYNPAASCDGSSITTELPSIQAAKSDSFAEGMFPTIGRSEGLRMGFYNICGGLKITITEEGIKSVTLRGHDNEVLAGTITVGFDEGGLPVVNNIADGSSIVTLYAPSGEALEVGKSYYLVFVPKVFENGFTLTFQKADLRQAVYDRTTSTTISRATFGALTAPDSGLEWSMPPYITIPDPNFSAYMLANFDTNGNGVMDLEEAQSVTDINVCTDNIASLEGIAYCSNLQSLSCGGGSLTWNEAEHSYVGSGRLTNLDLSANTALINLRCGWNKLTSLNISSNTHLSSLRCDGNKLTELDMSANTDLRALHCQNNQLVSLDVSKNINLETLICSGNQLVSLDVSNNIFLKNLNCSWNNFLENLYVSDQKIPGVTENRSTDYVPAATIINAVELESLVINTADELLAWLANPSPVTSLGADIDLTGREFTPPEFAGYFNGKNHTITYIIDAAADASFNPGMFSQVKGTIKNLKVAGSITTGALYAGGIAGAANNALFENCESSVAISSSVRGTYRFGGIVGSGFDLTITDCVNNGNISHSVANMGTANSAQLGGIVGHLESDGTIERCTNNGRLSYSGKGTARIGGICGYFISLFQGRFADCANTGEIRVSSNATSGYNYAGGITGYYASPEDAGHVVYERCVNTGNIIQTDGAANTSCRFGGIMCHCGGTAVDTSSPVTAELISCSNSGSITTDCGADTQSIGGIIGFTEKTTCLITCSSCTNTGSITMTANGRIGSVLGYSCNPQSTFTGITVGENVILTGGASAIIGMVIGSGSTEAEAALTAAITGNVRGGSIVKGETELELTADNYRDSLVGAGFNGTITGVTFGIQ